MTASCPALPFLDVLIFLGLFFSGPGMVFRVFSAVFHCVSRVCAGVERGKKSLVFWLVFLGFFTEMPRNGRSG